MEYTLSESSAKRVADVVRTVERDGVMRTSYWRKRYYHGFTGRVYLNGVVYDNLNEDYLKPWIKVVIDGSAAPTEEIGPPSNPFPPNEEWYEKISTYGDIHVIGTR